MPLKAIWAHSSAYSKFLFTAGVVLVSAAVFMILGTFAASAIYNISLLDLREILEDPTNPAAIPMLKFIQVASEIGAFIFPAFLIAYLFDQQPFGYLSLSKKVSITSALLVAIALIAALPLINYLGEINSRMSLPSFLSGVEKWMKESEERAGELTKQFLEMNSISDLLLNVVIIGLLPAIGEELLFRGVIQRIFSEWLKNFHAAIWISAILFSAMHLQFYGFIPRMMLGVMFGYLLVWSGSLWLPILAHFVNNASAVIFVYLFREEMLNIDPDKIGVESDYLAVLSSIVITGFLLWRIYRREKTRKENYYGY